MTLKELTKRIEVAIETAIEGSGEQASEVLVKDAQGNMLRINNVVWCEEASEFQIWAAKI